MRTRSHFCQIMLLIRVSPAEVPCQIPPPRQILPWGSSSLCAALGNGGETIGAKWIIEKYSPGSCERLASACMTKKLEPSRLSLDIGCLTRSSFPCGSTMKEPANCLEFSLDPSSYGQMSFFYWDFIIEPSALALPSTIVIVLLLLLSPFLWCHRRHHCYFQGSKFINTGHQHYYHCHDFYLLPSSTCMVIFTCHWLSLVQMIASVSCQDCAC